MEKVPFIDTMSHFAICNKNYQHISSTTSFCILYSQFLDTLKSHEFRHQLHDLVFVFSPWLFPGRSNFPRCWKAERLPWSPTVCWKSSGPSEIAPWGRPSSPRGDLAWNLSNETSAKMERIGWYWVKIQGFQRLRRPSP